MSGDETRLSLVEQGFKDMKEDVGKLEGKVDALGLDIAVIKAQQAEAMKASAVRAKWAAARDWAKMGGVATLIYGGPDAISWCQAHPTAMGGTAGLVGAVLAGVLLKLRAKPPTVDAQPPTQM